jgi:effector-binding domain-containing protein
MLATVAPGSSRIAASSSTLAILHWIEANESRQAGPMRELFLHVSMPVSRDDMSNVTEIQVPVKKASK